MTKVRLYPPKPDGTPDINAYGELIDFEDLPPGARRFDNIVTYMAAPDSGPDDEPIVVPNYVAPR